MRSVVSEDALLCREGFAGLSTLPHSAWVCSQAKRPSNVIEHASVGGGGVDQLGRTGETCD